MHLENSREVINANTEKLEMRKGKPTKPGFVLDTARWDPNGRVSLKDAPVQRPWEGLRKRRGREAAVKGGWGTLQPRSASRGAPGSPAVPAPSAEMGGAQSPLVRSCPTSSPSLPFRAPHADPDPPILPLLHLTCHERFSELMALPKWQEMGKGQPEQLYYYYYFPSQHRCNNTVVVFFCAHL